MIRPLSRRAAPWLLAGAATLFSGCAALSPPAPEPPSERIFQLWHEHARSVRAQVNWVLSARVAVHSEDDAWSGKLYWLQGKDAYQVSFVVPFGQGGLQLQGGPHQVEMRSSDGQVMVAKDAESLLYQQLSWQLPLRKLRYWVRGIPAPTSHDMPRLNFDAAGRLARLRQAGWDIEYPIYSKIGGLMLPRKVYLENTELSVRLVIDRWGTDDNSDG